MKIKVKLLIILLFAFVLFSGFQGGKYFLNNRLQELAFLVLMFLFAYTAIHTAFLNEKIAWNQWIWTAPLLIGYIMFSSSIVFAINAETSVVASLFAAREFLFILLAPTVYFLYRMGLSLVIIEQVFVATLIVLMLNYLFFYFTLDLKSIYFSKGYLSYLVVHDEWRGYRLKPPTFALFILTIYSLASLVKPGNELKKLFWIIILCIVGYIWFLIKARSQMATLVLALMLYPFFFVQVNRIYLMVLVLPIVILLAIPGVEILVDHFMHAEGAEVRAAAYQTAWENIQHYPVFGFGQSSGYSKTYQQIFGPKFFPSDIGIIGMWFKYGTVGALLYIYMNFLLFWRLLTTHWLYKKIYNKTNTLLFAILIFITALSFNIILNPGLAFAQGLTTGAFVIGFTSAYQHFLKFKS